MNHYSAIMAKLAITLSSILAFSVVSADDFDRSTPLLCAMSDYNECSILGCEPVLAASIQAPTFLRMNASEKSLKVINGGTERVSSVGDVDVIDGKLIIVGLEDGLEGVRDGVGYSISISLSTGNLVFSATTDDLAFTGFGACIKDS